MICSNLSPHAMILRIVGQRLSSLLLICLWHEYSSVESHWRMSTCQLSIFLKSFCASEATFFTNHNDSYFAFLTHFIPNQEKLSSQNLKIARMHYYHENTELFVSYTLVTLLIINESSLICIFVIANHMYTKYRWVNF